MPNQIEADLKLTEENARLKERLAKLEPAKQTFADLEEGETFTWQGQTWKKCGPNHAECCEPFRQYIPANDAVQTEAPKESHVASESQHPESKAGRKDRPADVPSQDA